MRDPVDANAAAASARVTASHVADAASEWLAETSRCAALRITNGATLGDGIQPCQSVTAFEVLTRRLALYKPIYNTLWIFSQC